MRVTISAQGSVFVSSDDLKSTGRSCPSCPGKIVTLAWVNLSQEVLVRNVELTRYHQPEEFGKSQKERGNTSSYVLLTSQNPSCWNPSWLSNADVTSKDLESEWLARDNMETNSITIKPQTVSHVVEQFSWVPLLCCCLPGHPFPTRSLGLSVCVSPLTSYFQVFDKSRLSDPGRDPLPPTPLPAAEYLIIILPRTH